MNLFRKLGRRVEQFMTDASTTGDPTAYRCQNCGARFEEPHERCPECDSGDVVPVEQ